MADLDARHLQKGVVDAGLPAGLALVGPVDDFLIEAQRDRAPGLMPWRGGRINPTMPWSLARRPRGPVAPIIFVTVLAVSMFGLGVIVEGAAQAKGSEWLSFAGALLGSALTVAGSIAVLEHQRTSEIRARRALLVELLDEVEVACVPFQLANEAAVQDKYGTTVAEKVKELQSAIRRVHSFRETMVPKTALMMRVRDDLAELSFDSADVVGWLKSMALYPKEADLGALNAIAHDVLGPVRAARKRLKEG